MMPFEKDVYKWQVGHKQKLLSIRRRYVKENT